MAAPSCSPTSESDIPADLARWCGLQEQAGCTTVLVSWDDAIRGALAVTDTVKPSAAGAVARLRGLGLRPVLLTGDNSATAEAVAAAAGIDEVISGALPAAKAQVIADLHAAGRSVAMVGDGVNDGPALAAARLGLALGSGTDVAICAADLILLRDDLEAVPDAITLARATFPHHPPQPGLGLLLQRAGHPAGRPRLPQPAARRGRHDPLLSLRRLEQPALAPLFRHRTGHALSSAAGVTRRRHVATLQRMAHYPRCRILAIIGSGETSPTMVTVHKELVSRLGLNSPKAIVLATPYAFQENADDVSARAQRYFADSVGLRVRIEAGTSPDADPRMAPPLISEEAEEREKRPSRPRTGFSPGRGARRTRSRTGGPGQSRPRCGTGRWPARATVLASAAAATAGRFTVPVYGSTKPAARCAGCPGLTCSARSASRSRSSPTTTTPKAATTTPGTAISANEAGRHGARTSG